MSQEIGVAAVTTTKLKAIVYPAGIVLIDRIWRGVFPVLFFALSASAEIQSRPFLQWQT
jgi:hypothetical protein